MWKIWIALLLPLSMIGQFNCSPYHPIAAYDINDDVVYSIAYISCLHAQGLTMELGTKSVQLGTTIMGARHQNATYLFAHYNKNIERFNVYGGPVMRINNDPAFGLFRVGVDTQIIGAVYITTNVVQMTPALNYANFGIKLIL